MSSFDVYDFDGTIYNGDSSKDFFLYAIKKDKKNIFLLPKIFFYLILYILKIINLKKFKEIFFSFYKNITNKVSYLNEFWQIHEKKVNKNILDQIAKEKLVYVVSSSPSFLLSPYLSRFNNIKLIATEFDKNIKMIGDNCKGEFKVKALLKENKKFKINNFYTDSLNDLPLVNKAKTSFLVTNGQIVDWDINILKKRKEKKFSLFIFYLFLILYLILGIQISFNYNINQNNLFFESDTIRVIGDMSDIFYNHYRLSVHPLFVLLTEPIYFIVSGFTQDKMLALVIISSLISSLSVMFLYKTISIYSENNKMNLLISSCYGFSFSIFIFTAGIELYNIASFILILLWYLIAKIIKHGWLENYFWLLIFLGILTLSITITNFIVFLIGGFILFISRKVKLKKLLLINILVVLFFILGSYFQNLIWHNTPIITNINQNTQEEKMYTELSFNISKLRNVVKNCYYNAIISPDLALGYNKDMNNMIVLQKMSNANKIILTMFYLLLIVLILSKIRQNFFMNFGIILTLFFNTLLHIVYGNNDCFLYSMHFLYLIFILFGINISKETKNNKSSIIMFIDLLLIFEIFFNIKAFLKVINFTSIVYEANYYAQIFRIREIVMMSFIVIILALLIINLIYYFCKKLLYKNNYRSPAPYITLIFVLVILLESVFVVIQTAPTYKQILWYSLSDSRKIKADENYKLFLDNYPTEVNYYLSYVDEYKTFIKKYNCDAINVFPNIKFYLLGLGDREKLLYKDGKIITIDSGEVIKEFDEDYSLIIPNEMTILIKEKNGNYSKIYENNDGVYIESNNEKNLIEGTDKYIKLYNFENEPYQNIKKVLYSEILFNIKHNKIIPNIIVYENAWYRDAAIASMVLKYTHNEDLISEWVSQIDEVYDKQNNGIKEPDNLGELLYIISTQDNINKTLVNKIKIEAEHLAKNNKDGYYISGQTDFSPQYKYQNLWYEFGLNALNENSPYDYNELTDTYSALFWQNHQKITDNYLSSPEYPYLTWANYHTTHQGTPQVNIQLYPLSWEKNGSQANYENMIVIDKAFVDYQVSPTHVWTSSEMLLFLLDESGKLIY